MKKNKLMKISMAALAVTMGIGYIRPMTLVTPVHAYETQENSVELINTSTIWSYLDDNTDPKTDEDVHAWTKESYDITNWKSASGTFGAKNGAIGSADGYIPTQLLNQYMSGTTDIPAYFFRTTFNVETLDNLTNLTAKFAYDDGMIVYINGQEVASYDMTTTDLSKYNSEDLDTNTTNMYYAGHNGSTTEVTLSLSKDEIQKYLKTGENVIAVELHQGRPSSSDIYFSCESMVLNYGEVAIDQKAVSLTVGKNENEMNLTWYANSSDKGYVHLIKADQLIDGEFPENGYKTIEVEGKQALDSGYYYFQTVLEDLESKTQYAYRVVNEETISDIYTINTQDLEDDSYNFLFVGDPQIGASGNATTDTEKWDVTLSSAVATFNPSFLLSAGDQVNTASSESEYAGYLEHEELTQIPQATTIGNHDAGSNAYSQHYNLPNVSDVSETASSAGNDYYYVYDNTLFMVINTNAGSIASHKAFAQEAIKEVEDAGYDIQWKVVTFHQSIFSTASHWEDSQIQYLRAALPAVFDELEIDVVLMGHDHVYTRSNIITGGDNGGYKIVEDTSDKDYTVNPEGILYMTANSASGSKYYNLKNATGDYSAETYQNKKRTVSNIEVSETAFKITTYEYSDDYGSEMTLLDEFTVYKLNEEELTLTDETTNTTVVVPTESVDKEAELKVTQITDGESYESVKSVISENDFIMLDVDLVKNDKELEIFEGKSVTLKLTVPEGYENYALYQLTDKGLEEIEEYQSEDGQLVLEVSELGTYAIKDLTEKYVDDNLDDDDNQDDSTDQEDSLNQDMSTEETLDNNVSIEESSDKVADSMVNTGDYSSILGYFALVVSAIGCALASRKRKEEK